jgi:hypothetical protein
MTKKKQLAFEEHEVETFFIGDYAFHIGERFIDEAIAATTAPYPHGVGTVVKVGRKFVYLRMDIGGEVIKYEPSNLVSIGDNAAHSYGMLYMHLRALGHSQAAIHNWLDDAEWKRNCKKLHKSPPSHLKSALQINTGLGRTR